jgi:hypothetical protein
MRTPLVQTLAAIAFGCVAGAASAQPGTLAEWQAQDRAERALEALSARYTQIWAGLDPAQKAKFSVQERAWLNEGRWLEQRSCLAARALPAEAAAICLAEVTERRLHALSESGRVLASFPAAGASR